MCFVLGGAFCYGGKISIGSPNCRVRGKLNKSLRANEWNSKSI